MERHPDFQREPEAPGLERTRELANKRQHLLWEQQFYGVNEVGGRHKIQIRQINKLSMGALSVPGYPALAAGIRPGHLQLRLQHLGEVRSVNGHVP